jgi:hypothetical protein
VKLIFLVPVDGCSLAAGPAEQRDRMLRIAGNDCGEPA